MCGLVRSVVGEQSIRPGATEFAILLVLAYTRNANLGEIYKRLYQLKKLPLLGMGDWAEKLLNSVRFENPYDDWKTANNEVTNVMSSLRLKLSGLGICDLDALIHQRNHSFEFPEDKIKIINDEKIRVMLDKAFA